MMRTSLLVLLAGMALGAGCSDDREAPSSVRISPTVSRVTGLYFDKEDRIGLTISRTSGDYVTNRLMTYDGSVFTASGLKWYESTQETSTLTAYYPYSEAGVPSAFSVEARPAAGLHAVGSAGSCRTGGQAGQRTRRDGFLSPHVAALRGRGEQRFLAGRRSEDRRFGRRGRRGPRRAFGEGESGCGGGADRGFRGGADSRYRAVLVPQQTTLDVEVELQDGSVCRKSVSDALLEGGRCYDLSVVISGGGTPQIEVSISGDVVDWVDGGELVGSDGGNDGADGVDHEGNTTGRWRSTEKSGWRRTCGTSRREPSSEQEFGILRAVLR